MTNTDHRVFFSALGFLAVILRDAPQDGLAARASAISELIEAYCTNELPAQNETKEQSESVANLISSLVNDNRKNKDVLTTALKALELCLEDSPLTSTSEQAAVQAVSQIRQAI